MRGLSVNQQMTPKFFSFEFHVRFFPSLLRSRLRPKERAGTGFPSSLEPTVALAVCFILVMIGLPSAIDNKSLFGWVLTGLGLIGFAALFIQSISSHWGEKPSYDDFLIGIFFFFIILGLTAGIFVGTMNHSFFLGLLVGLSGLLAGYVFGIFAGLWFQYLGWMAVILNLIAGLAVIGMFIVDMVLLAGGLS